MLRLIAIVLSMTTSAAGAKEPNFGDFPVAVYVGKVANPILDTPEKRQFRTRISKAAANGPNFAGHFALAAWGCGTSCLFSAVIDVKTGVVAFFPATVCCWPSDQKGILFKADSSLVVFKGMLDEQEPSRDHPFEFKDGTFRPVGN